MNSRVSPALAKALLLEAKYKKPAPVLESPDANITEEKPKRSVISRQLNTSEKDSEINELSAFSSSNSSPSKPSSSELDSTSKNSKSPTAHSLVVKIHTVDELITLTNSAKNSGEEAPPGTSIQSSHDYSLSYSPFVVREIQQSTPHPEMLTNVNSGRKQNTLLKKERTVKPETTQQFSTYTNDKQTQTSISTQVTKSNRDRSTSPLTFLTKTLHLNEKDIHETRGERNNYHSKNDPSSEENITLRQRPKSVRANHKRRETVHRCCCMCKSVNPFPSLSVPIVQVPYFTTQPESQDNWFASCMVQQLQLLRLQLETQHQTYQMLCEWSQTKQIHLFNT